MFPVQSSFLGLTVVSDLAKVVLDPNTVWVYPHTLIDFFSTSLFVIHLADEETRAQSCSVTGAGPHSEFSGTAGI